MSSIDTYRLRNGLSNTFKLVKLKILWMSAYQWTTTYLIFNLFTNLIVIIVISFMTKKISLIDHTYQETLQNPEILIPRFCGLANLTQNADVTSAPIVDIAALFNCSIVYISREVSGMSIYKWWGAAVNVPCLVKWGRHLSNLLCKAPRNICRDRVCLHVIWLQNYWLTGLVVAKVKQLRTKWANSVICLK